MRKRLIIFLKKHPKLLNLFWKVASILLNCFSVFLPINKKRIIFASFGGRKFDDSPRAIYEEMCKQDFFNDWTFVWAFVEPEKYELNRGDKVKIDTLSFFKLLLTSKVWVSNSGMSRGIKIYKKGIVDVETWHGTPLKKIGGEENQNSMLSKSRKKNKGKIDSMTIRCAQSKFDQEIFSRIFNANKNSILLCDLPRNDKLKNYTFDEVDNIKRQLNISKNKKVILYVPTYREYLVNSNKDIYIAPPLNISKWKKELGKEYVLLIRAHYAITKSLNIKNDEFVYDVTNFSSISDLYLISDIMISDYSSAYFDYSILCRPMLCFAYDLEEYKEKRGLYLDLNNTLPCSVDSNEDDLINKIKTMNYDEYSKLTFEFHKKYSPYAGNASKMVVNKIKERIEEG